MPEPRTLSPTELAQFQDEGFVVVRQAFARADARAMEEAWWAELADVHGVLRDDRATWRRLLPDLKRAKHDPIQAKILTPRVHGVIDDLLGEGAWPAPRDWGRTLTTFPEGGDWDVPTGLWHWDSPTAWHAERLAALFVISFIGPVAPRSGGTLLLAGSYRLLMVQETALTPDQRAVSFARRRDLFERSHPWLAALAGKAPSPPDRIAAFMQAGTEIEGVHVRVVEATGEPGDMIFCHPAIVHCAAPNRGERPRFMRIKQQLMTHAGKELLRNA